MAVAAAAPEGEEAEGEDRREGPEPEWGECGKHGMGGLYAEIGEEVTGERWRKLKVEKLKVKGGENRGGRC